MTSEEWDEIEPEAYRRFMKWNSGVRGQVVTKENGLDYWVALVAYERGWSKGFLAEIEEDYE